MSTVFATPQEASAAFYDAFERRDLESMMQVWATDERIVCIHPNGTRVQGRAQVTQSWRGIFSGGEPLQLTLSDEQYTQDALLAIQLVREHVAVRGRVRGTVSATNVFQLVAGGWRMILHHASVLPPSESGRARREAVLH